MNNICLSSFIPFIIFILLLKDVFRICSIEVDKNQLNDNKQSLNLLNLFALDKKFSCILYKSLSQHGERKLKCWDKYTSQFPLFLNILCSKLFKLNIK